MPQLVFIHVVISLLGIGSGIVVLLGFFGNKRLDAGTHFFLMTATLTSVTGFLPAHQLLLSHSLGVLSLVTLAIAGSRATAKKKQGGWRKTYAVTAMISLTSTSSC